MSVCVRESMGVHVGVSVGMGEGMGGYGYWCRERCVDIGLRWCTGIYL